MRITFRNNVRIIAIHECQTFMFSVDALLGIEAGIPNDSDLKAVGVYIDDHYNSNDVLWGDEYHLLIGEELNRSACIMVPEKKYKELLKCEKQVKGLKNAGVDFAGHGVAK